MRFDIITIFPEFFDGPLDYGIVRRAREGGLVEIGVHDLREYTHDRHRTVDDRPFGGGEGMVLKPEPIFEAVETILGKDFTAEGAEETESTKRRAGGARLASSPRLGSGQAGQALVVQKTAVVLLSAAGKLFRQETARRYAQLERVVLICGRYEGVDERVAEHLATEELSVGDYVLSGGELPAALVVDAVTRLLPGALGNEASAVQESFSEAETGQPSAVSRRQPGAGGRARRGSATLTPSGVPLPCGAPGGILDYPHYTRPAEYRGWAVPEVLLSGNHAEIAQWRRRAALEKTLRNRPELLGGAASPRKSRGP